VCFGVVEENCTHERLHGRIVRGKAVRGGVGHRPTRDHRTGINVAARRCRATMPDDVALMKPQRAMGRHAFGAGGGAAASRRRVNATHPIFPRRRARAGQPAKP
jgi:hypothetical protein